MANALADAQNNLRNFGYTYQGVRENDERLRARTRELSREAENDTNGEVTPAGVLIEDDHTRMNSSLDSSLLSVMRTFDNHLSLANNLGRNEYLAKLFEKNSAQNDDVQVKSRGTKFGAASAGVNTGDSVLLMCSKDANDDVIESATIELLTFKALAASIDKPGLGQEVWSVQGAGNSSQSEFTAGGKGVKIGGLNATGGGRSSILDNASFDLPFNGTGVAKIQSWDILSGDDKIAFDTNNIAQDRGESHGALAITGDCEFQFNFRTQGKSISYLASYVAGLFAKTTAFTGDLVITFGSAGSLYTATINFAASTVAYALHTLDPDDSLSWRQNFDTDGNPVLNIVVTNYVGGTLYLDDMVAEALVAIGGRPAVIVSGTTATVKNDSHTQECTLTVNTAGDTTLSGGAAGDTIDSIIVAGTEILPEVVTFITDLNTTVDLVVTAINSVRTFPNYIASNGGAGKVTITQEVPVEGAFVVTTLVTDNGGGLAKVDTNLSGSLIGTLQDSLVRRSGQYLPHKAAASSGWEDHAA